MSASGSKIVVRNTRPEDFRGIRELGLAIYPKMTTWSVEQLASHLRVFPKGQFVAEETESGRIVGSASSLIVKWDEYSMDTDWKDFTDAGFFTNHDPENGRTLYGADVMVHPEMQGLGVGRMLYKHARFGLAESLGLLRIRAGARLRDYRHHAHEMDPETYVQKIIRGELKDRTLSFQLQQGFHVIGVVSDYIVDDPASRGCAAVIEWINPAVARPEDFQNRNPKFIFPRQND